MKYAENQIEKTEFQESLKKFLEKEKNAFWISDEFKTRCYKEGAKAVYNSMPQKTIYNEFLARVFSELKSQDQKWGSQRRKHPLEWQSILVEEVGEIAKEMCDNNFQATLPTNYEQELIQAAAVLFRMYAQNRINLFGENFKKEY